MSPQSWKLLPKLNFLVILFIWFVWVVQLRIRYQGEMIKQCVHDVCVCVSTVHWYGHRNPQSIGWRTPRGCYDAWITAVIKREDWERERVGNSSAEWHAGREHREAIVHFSRGPQRVVCTCSPPPVQIACRPCNCQQRSFTSTYRPSGWIGWSVHTEAGIFLLREAWLCGGSFSSSKCVCVLDDLSFFYSLSTSLSLSLSLDKKQTMHTPIKQQQKTTTNETWITFQKWGGGGGGQYWMFGTLVYLIPSKTKAFEIAVFPMLLFLSGIPPNWTVSRCIL